jgi:hypothetical protein
MRNSLGASDMVLLGVQEVASSNLAGPTINSAVIRASARSFTAALWRIGSWPSGQAVS